MSSETLAKSKPSKTPKTRPVMTVTTFDTQKHRVSAVIRAYGATGGRLQAAKEFIEARAHLGISLADAARVAHFSMFHFCRLFSLAFGMPPKRFMGECQIGRAKQAIRNGGAFRQIASNCGFKTESHFNIRFKAIAGMTPGAFRKSIAKEVGR